jgi:2-phosphosulfolactate phosphatase
MTAFSQKVWACRCEWGPAAVAALAPADVTIIVDVFSFTTCVDIATSRGVAILPFPWNDESAAEFAREKGAELAGRRRQARYSLAPESYLDAPAGLRCVLPSPNGAMVTLAAAGVSPMILAGCLRNARAIANAATHMGASFNVIPAGELWRDGWLRDRPPEADSAVAAFERHRETLVAALDACGSGRELDERGHSKDKVIAGDLDISSAVPRFDGIAFVAWQATS